MPSPAAVFSGFRRFSFGLVGLAVVLLAAGCASEGANPSFSERLPGAISARWTPPEFATRPVDGERAAVLDACVATANALGFAVSRFDGATGKISATRRQDAGFDGAREDMLEVTVTKLAPDVATVAIVLREAVESGSRDERGGGMVTAGLVRDRAPYDAFFARLAEAFSPEAPLAAPATTVQ